MRVPSFVPLVACLAFVSCGRASHTSTAGAPAPDETRAPGRTPAPARPAPGRGAADERDRRMAEAEAAMAAGDWSRAWRKLEKALRAGPETARLRTLRGSCASHLRNDLARARAELLRAAALDPRDPEPRHLLADMALAQGRPDEASRLVAEILRFAPDHVPTRLLEARLLRGAGEPERALERLEGLPEADAELWTLRGKALLDLGRAAEAEAAFRRALALEPTDVPARFGLVTALLRLGRDDEAAEQRAVFERLRPLFSRSPHDLEPDPGKRLTLLRELGRDYPEMITVWAELAKQERRVRGLAAARAVLEEALALHPESSRLHALLGDAFAQAGDEARARRELERARRLAGRERGE